MDWITQMHDSLQLHPTHKYILGNKCLISLQQPIARNFSQSHKKKSKSSQNSSACINFEHKIIVLHQKSIEIMCTNHYPLPLKQF